MSGKTSDTVATDDEQDRRSRLPLIDASEQTRGGSLGWRRLTTFS